MNQHIAIVGATGAVGTEFMKLLENRDYPLKSLKLLASSRSTGKKLLFRGESLPVEELTAESFKGVDLAFFSAGGTRSKEFAPHAVDSGTLVIDNSSAFRMQEGVPLVVPEVNPEASKSHQGIIANPNCSTIQMVVALHPLHKVATIKRVVVSSYQATSGAGAAGMQELLDQVKAFNQGQPLSSQVFQAQIAFNVIPHIGNFMDNGYTEEEMKMVKETRKIMSVPDMKISATCVRVPVLRSHSEAINIETESKLTVEEAKTIFSNTAGIIVKDKQEPGGYPLPWDVAETYDTYVGRIREDISVPNGLAFWVVADQLYKGAALNALQISEWLNSHH